jgi:hypothetical protein
MKASVSLDDLTMKLIFRLPRLTQRMVSGSMPREAEL